MSVDCDSFFDAYGCVFTSCRSYVCPFPLVRLSDAVCGGDGDNSGARIAAIALARQCGRHAPTPRLLQLCLSPAPPHDRSCASFAQLLSPHVRPVPLDRDALFFAKLQCVGDVCAVVSRSTAGQRLASYYRVVPCASSSTLLQQQQEDHEEDEEQKERDDDNDAQHHVDNATDTSSRGRVGVSRVAAPAAHVERAVLRNVVSTSLVVARGSRDGSSGNTTTNLVDNDDDDSATTSAFAAARRKHTRHSSHSNSSGSSAATGGGGARKLWALHTHAAAVASSSTTTRSVTDTGNAALLAGDDGVTGVVQMDVEALFAGHAQPLWSLHSSQLGSDGDVVALRRGSLDAGGSSYSYDHDDDDDDDDDDDGSCAVVVNTAGVLRVDARQPPAATFDIPAASSPLRGGGVAARHYYVTMSDERVLRVHDARKLPQPLLQLSCPHDVHVRATPSRRVALLLSATQVGILDAPLGAVVAAQSFSDGVVLDATLLPCRRRPRRQHDDDDDDDDDDERREERDVQDVHDNNNNNNNNNKNDCSRHGGDDGGVSGSSAGVVSYCVSTSNSLLYDVTVTY